jgi:hypothetical protein
MSESVALLLLIGGIMLLAVLLVAFATIQAAEEHWRNEDERILRHRHAPR